MAFRVADITFRRREREIKMKNITKKIMQLLLTVVLTITTVFSGITGMDDPVFASTRSKVWNGKSDTSWYTGDKLSYDISTAEQLAGLAELINTNEDYFGGITINLTKDIVLNRTGNFKNWNKKPPKNEWAPIGMLLHSVNCDPAFEGIFNGNGHKIIGLYVSNPGYGGLWGSGSGYNAGLFGKIRYGEVVNLKIEKVFLRAFGNVGAITAESQGAFFINNEVTDLVAYIGNGNTGGLVGCSNRELIDPGTVAWLASAAMGIVWNPLLFMDRTFGEDFKGSIIYNCKANRLKYYKDPEARSGSGGNRTGIIGKYDNTSTISLGKDNSSGGIGVANCLVTNCNWLSGVVSPYEKNDDIHIVKNCYGCGNKLDKKNGQKKFADCKTVKTIKKGKLKSKAFAKKLGDGYSWKKGNAPVLKHYILQSEGDEEAVEKEFRVIEDGYYTIGGNGYFSDVNSDSSGFVYTTDEENAGKYYIEYHKQGYYTLKSAANGKYLELDQKENKLILDNDYDPNKFTQLWVLEADDDGFYIYSKVRGGYIDYDPGVIFFSGRGLYVDTSGSEFHATWKLEKQ